MYAKRVWVGMIKSCAPILLAHSYPASQSQQIIYMPIYDDKYICEPRTFRSPCLGVLQFFGIDHHLASAANPGMPAPTTTKSTFGTRVLKVSPVGMSVVSCQKTLSYTVISDSTQENMQFKYISHNKSQIGRLDCKTLHTYST